MLTSDFSGKKIEKSAFKLELKALELKLTKLQLQIQQHEIPVLIALDGFSASGKGTIMKHIVHSLDPRLFDVYSTAKLNEDVIMRPFLWRFFTKTPLKGRITIIDRSWGRLNIKRSNADILKLSNKEKESYFDDINTFERQLLDDRTVVLKFFLHISKEEQKKRFKSLSKDEGTKWRVQNKSITDYDENLKIYTEMIDKNSESPWNVVECNDYRFAAIKVLKTVIEEMETAIKDVENQKKPKGIFKPSTKNLLASVDLAKVISDADYKKELDFYQKKMAELGYMLYAKRLPVVVVFEGWDAAGKGGNIKRITEPLDPRGYEVIPTSAPTKEEINHHYLWRFYNKLPKDGHIAIFDRSWYGRVLVERIEGYSDFETWTRAYKEINDFERHLSNHGVVMFKFWVHIDEEEQLKRFNARKENPLKQYKITDEDWRNREQWGEYEKAANDMLDKTSTKYAPWTIIESNDKKFARIKTLKIITDKLSKLLE